MKISSLESKTIRPGLGPYSFYHSDRHLKREMPQVIPAKTTAKNKTKSRLLTLALFALIGFASYSLLAYKDNRPNHASTNTTSSNNYSQKAALGAAPATKQAAAPVPANKCAGNSIPQFIVISITDRHLWVCEASKQVRDYPVVTGMQKIEDNATPVGTYKIYAKQRDTVLTGSASTGSWRQPVSYWMPFLDNTFGTYGFHDASWRKVSEFGHTDPYSDKGSHGCIQMSVANSEWLYNWAHVGATVTITL